ncbi:MULTISPECIES: hypothetical protein [Streptomyces griseus group]|uniref:hypothetical protein n=1 Tax=Streptomyces griseus group TaxID=629295 RepID=UPI002E0FA540|nr:hypothetical protein OG366_00225 [Streptomyces cyaneofuscatus]WSI52704.1 hypothetical protein OG366_36935 [Streptomyces cyaneofuscatus]WST12507.1 hypothetical protein OG721_00310 [Streptomyces microflavus]WST19530.1 hypothetical protein OG721_38790 [Streptomyces microflavus]
MTDFNELIPIALQMLPHMIALFDRPGARTSRRRSRHGDSARPPAGPVTVPASGDGAALVGLVRGMPPGSVLRYEAPDGTVLTCWSAPGAQPGEYRLW